MLTVEHGQFSFPFFIALLLLAEKSREENKLKDLVNAMCNIRNCLNNEMHDWTN